MSIEEIKFMKALERDELVQFLGGFPGYYIQPLAADLPTEYDDAFYPIRTRIKNEPDLAMKTLEAIKTLAEDVEYGWGAIFYIANLYQLKQHQGIDLLSPELIASVADSLRKNKVAFIALKRWEGKNHEDGVWALVRNKNRNLHNDYGITVLPEEL